MEKRECYDGLTARIRKECKEDEQGLEVNGKRMYGWNHRCLRIDKKRKNLTPPAMREGLEHVPVCA